MSAKLNLKIACDPFEFVRGMRDGSVGVDGIDLVVGSWSRIAQAARSVA